MYEVSVKTSFTARHSVQLPNGEMEPMHEHDWVVEAIFTGPQLDDRGLLVDFVEIQQDFERLLEPLADTDLNGHPLLGGRPSTAEVLALRIFEQLRGHKRQGVSLGKVVVTEAPGCSAAYCAASNDSISSLQKD